MVEVVEVLQSGIKVTKWYSREDIQQDLGISSPTVSRYIRLIESTIGKLKYGFKPRARVFNQKQYDAITKVRELYKSDLITIQVKEQIKSLKRTA